MTFSQKIQKAFVLKTYTRASSIQGLRRLLWHTKNFPKALQFYFSARRNRQHLKAVLERQSHIKMENLLKHIDTAQLERIRDKYQDGKYSFWFKYLDVEKWLTLNMRYVRELGLIDHPPQDVLDLGCGAGFFLYLCKRLGCNTLGVDLDIDPIFNEMIKLFGLKRIPLRITKQLCLPSFEGRTFDLITAWMICFNDFDNPDKIWTGKDWEFLIHDLHSRLNPNGRIIFSLNKQLDGKLYSEEIGKVFHKYADHIDGKRILFTKEKLDALIPAEKNRALASRQSELAQAA